MADALALGRRVKALRIRTDSRPLYVQAEDALREVVATMGLGVGERLPPEIELARLLGVSRSTVREALRNLELRREVRRIHGLGTLVTAPSGPVVAGLETLDSLESLAQGQGWTCGTVDTEVSRSQLSPGEAVLLSREVGSEATRLLRDKTRDGRKIACMASVVPADVLEPDTVEAEFSSSIIDMFRARGQPELDQALADVRVEPPDAVVAGRLEVHAGAALLLLEEVFFDPQGKPFCLNRNWYVPGSMRLELVRRPR